MANDTDSEMKTITLPNLNVDNYRKLVQTYLTLHVYDAALFWADKVVALTAGNPRDVYWLAQCMFSLKQYHRAAHILRSNNLDKAYILCNYLTVRCLFESNEHKEALKVLNSIDMEAFLQNTNANASLDDCLFDDTPKSQIQSSVLLIKGKVLEAMDNRSLAAECYKQAVVCDVHCYQAFDALIKHHMLTAAEEQDLLNSLPINQQCTVEESEVIHTLYRSKLKKYHTSSTVVVTSNDSNKMCVENQPHSSSDMVAHNNMINAKTSKQPNSNKDKPQQMQVDILASSTLAQLNNSLDVLVAQAEQFYYNCDYVRCNKLTEKILKVDAYHMACLPIHISCQVELKQGNKLFMLAHNLVDLYPNLAVSWFAVGCYYYVIGKRDTARRFLSKATTLDRLFGPAWLAFGHSFAVENEHDQAMAAYFKASQLMRGCHLPLLYIGLECGLTNNIRLAEKFFKQAQTIAPDDPYVMHEMGVIAFQNLDYKGAEKHFLNALNRIKSNQNPISDQWEPLLNNLGHTCRKLKKYEESLEYHHQALGLSPQSASSYSSIGYVYALMGKTQDAVDWFHKALGLRKDDTVSATMLNYVIEQLSEEQPPYPDAPDCIPNFKALEGTNVNMTLENSSVLTNRLISELSNSNMSIEVEMSDVSGAIKD